MLRFRFRFRFEWSSQDYSRNGTPRLVYARLDSLYYRMHGINFPFFVNSGSNNNVPVRMVVSTPFAPFSSGQEYGRTRASLKHFEFVLGIGDWGSISYLSKEFHSGSKDRRLSCTIDRSMVGRPTDFAMTDGPFFYCHGVVT
jgi:hypothetical protein